MGLFSKKKEEEPQIPLAPTDNQEDVNVLPATPGDGRDSSTQEAIKLAVQDSSLKSEGILGPSNSINGMKESSSLPELPKITEPLPRLDIGNNKYSDLPNLPNVSEELPPLPINRTITESRQVVVEKPQEEFKLEEPKVVKKDANETIFVRIDKFNTAKKDVQDISKDLKRIEDVLSKLLEVKIQEDEEVEEINKSIEEIKEKISKVDTEVFNRI